MVLDRTTIPSMKRIVLWTLLLLSLAGTKATATAHQEHERTDLPVGLEERTGQNLPLGVTLYDESGRAVRLRELIRLPTLLTPVYYSCPDVCSLLLHHLTETLNRLAAEPDKDYQVITFSFDETEKPSLALEKKRFYLGMMNRPFPEGAWRFLTGDRQNIEALTEAIGFRFKREGSVFQHPVAIVVLSPEGKITRYLYGTDPLPFDVKMGILEASEGRIGPPVSRVLRFCFSYDPRARRYVFNTLKVTGIATLLFALCFILFLLVKGKKKRPAAG